LGELGDFCSGSESVNERFARWGVAGARERAKGLRANELEANRHFLKPYVVGLLNLIVAVKNHLPRKITGRGVVSF